ncbi:hypothetical protein SDA22_00180 [Legionella pneumophila serogroup 1]|uniref:hypothetical protein n=1 Tax=Legionella pneumophila TaxID=446 RepID=UPI0007709940|nr:hypothetical protein [Legionella pneumophila]QIB23912.1 hypothetical protein GCO85_05745 [Legionella pneumophila]CZG20717.1 Uncharacterised protein [Legionella pneumophila]CZG24837.1 Uncharacterised protein [Legionella pneumophila]HAT1980385.1 hypothetical protein [Legionella pneumophila]HAT4422707.1 hypothetical protein [Legionella pneumophila]
MPLLTCSRPHGYLLLWGIKANAAISTLMTKVSLLLLILKKYQGLGLTFCQFPDSMKKQDLTLGISL